MGYHTIITIEAEKRSGKPCIRGTRMTVTDVLEYPASGMTHQELRGEFAIHGRGRQCLPCFRRRP